MPNILDSVSTKLHQFIKIQNRWKILIKYLHMYRKSENNLVFETVRKDISFQSVLWIGHKIFFVLHITEILMLPCPPSPPCAFQRKQQKELRKKWARWTALFNRQPVNDIKSVYPCNCFWWFLSLSNSVMIPKVDSVHLDVAFQWEKHLVTRPSHVHH